MVIEFEEFSEINEDLVYLGDEPEQYKDAILGLTYDSNHIVYSYEKLQEIMMKENRWTEEEADEWISYNTARAIDYMGEYKPILINEYVGNQK